jgi:hypothetical protein
MRPVQLSADGWQANAFLATGFTDRLLGRFRVPPRSGVVIPARSVHSLGQREAMEIVGLDRRMRVVAARTLEPNRIALIRSARMIVELPAGSPVPALSERVVITHV